MDLNPLNAELNPICYLLALLAHHFLHVSRIRVKSLTLRLLMSYIYRVFQEECARLREGVPYVKVYRYNPKHICPKLNGYGDNGQRKVWSSGGSTHCTLSADSVPHVCPRLPCQITEIPLTLLRQYSTMADYACHV